MQCLIMHKVLALSLKLMFYQWDWVWKRMSCEQYYKTFSLYDDIIASPVCDITSIMASNMQLGTIQTYHYLTQTNVMYFTYTYTIEMV